MTVERDALAKRFADLSDDALRDRLRSDGLTDLAKDVAEREMHIRGLSLEEIPKDSADVAEPEELLESDDDHQFIGDVVTLVGHLKSFEAEILKSRLEIEGVYAVVIDANLERVGVALPAAGGGARVLVAERDFDRAKEVLKKLQRGDYRLEDSDTPPACPHCGGVSLSNFIPGFFASLFKYGGRPSQRTRCATCGYSWPSLNSSI